MTEEQKNWHQNWFNEDYLKLYPHRNIEEAEHQIDFLIRAMGLSGSEKILDLGCGSGRHAIALANRGYSVVGIDASQYLIDIANEKLKEVPNLPARFLTSDILKIGDQGVYDVVISMFTSFGYYDDDDENARIFGVVRNHLQRDGRFFFDYLHPYDVKKDLVEHEQVKLNGESVGIHRVIVDDQVIKTITFPDREYQEKVKLYTRDQIENMLSKYRLTVVDCWNDYEGNPWDEEGDRQIFFCRAI